MIVIATSHGREAWLADLLVTLPPDIPAMVCYQHDYELGKLRWVVERTDLSRFWLLQDSVVIHDPSFLYEGLLRAGSVPLCNDPAPFGMYLGVYERSVLADVGTPVVQDKRAAIRLEYEWTRRYWTVAGCPPAMFPHLADRNAAGIEHRHGRDNLVLRNDHLTKYKGTWA